MGNHDFIIRIVMLVLRQTAEMCMEYQDGI